jgi:hypothetical protein
MTVFIVPPRDVVLEIGYELLRRGERILVLCAAFVTMVAFADLVIVSKHAYAAYHIRQPVLVAVIRALKRLWNLPENKFCKGDFGVCDAGMERELGSGIGVSA